MEGMNNQMQEKSPTVTAGNEETQVSEKKRLVALLLCLFLGTFGIHRFYVGKIGTGILYLLTVGILGIGAIVDCILILCGKFTDKEGKTLVEW